MSALKPILIEMIKEDGPLPLDRYMALCLSHPQHGYYMTRDPFGAGGDFTTAPEISQMFGELIGIWVAEAHQSLGAPRKFALVELGPGRGTLMADVLRTLERAEAVRRAAEVHFVEMSPVLREAQRERVPDATWHGSISSLPARPSLVIANEFFDALPVRQFERKGGQVFERRMGVEGNDLAIGLSPSAAGIPPGEGVWEDHSIREGFATALGDHVSRVGGLILAVDYGHVRSAFGDTLQAVKAHKPCAVTDFPGEADLTAHVDFESLARGFAKGGMAKAGLMTQREFLMRMGLQQRLERLSQSADDRQRRELLTAVDRLAGQGQMGDLFKVLAVASRDVSLPYPFGA